MTKQDRIDSLIQDTWSMIECEHHLHRWNMEVDEDIANEAVAAINEETDAKAILVISDKAEYSIHIEW